MTAYDPAADQLPAGRRLAGRRIVTTRERPGQLDQLLTGAGAEVVHIPLIEIDEAADGGRALAAALDRLATYDWIVVTSRHGAERVAEAVAATEVRAAAVGTTTAETLEIGTGRPVDLVPDVQRAAALVETFAVAVEDPCSILVAQADRAEPELVDGLRALGHHVDAAIAYTTRLRLPSPSEVTAALAADAVVFASGSAAIAWAGAMGSRTPPVVCVIGPTTAAAATEHGIKVTAVAADHSIRGLFTAVVDALAESL